MRRFAAEKATIDPRYAIAKANARMQRRLINHEQGEALSHLTDDDRHNVQTSTHIPWVAQLMASPKPHFGLVCLRTAYDDDEAWKNYKEHIIRSSRSGFWLWDSAGRVSKKWKIEFIDDDRERLDGASLEDMCRSALIPLYHHRTVYLLAQVLQRSAFVLHYFLHLRRLAQRCVPLRRRERHLLPQPSRQ